VLAYLIRRSRSLLAAAAAASVASGVCSVLLLTRINAALSESTHESRSKLVIQFAVLALSAFISHAIASVLFERLSQSAHAELRTFVCARVMGTGFRRLETIGGARVQSALSEHCANVAEFFVSAPTILVNGIIVLGCLAYMAWLSWPIFLAAALAIALGSLGYHLAHLWAIRHLDAASKEQDRLFEYFRSLVDGAKELRLNSLKRIRFFSELLAPAIQTVRRERGKGMSIFLVSATWGNFLVYAFIGLVLFVLVGDAPDRTRVMTGFALMLVYLVAPLEVLLLSLPRANLARVSAERIDEITRELEGPVELLPSSPSSFETLGLHGVAHSYRRDGSDDMFTLGPVDLKFEPGQITYLLGGNGSGKSTLAKVLVGLYAPERGTITLDGKDVDDAGRDRYRQLFSAVFSDFHLFERLLDGASAELDARGNHYLQRLDLHHKVELRGGAFSTRSLSQGQRKRLALAVAYLEDRPFLVFDEWAADQDPVFKEVFYRELLPELRAQGKAILVISHDDRYFHLADRLLRLENGKLVPSNVHASSDATGTTARDAAPRIESALRD